MQIGGNELLGPRCELAATSHRLDALDVLAADDNGVALATGWSSTTGWRAFETLGI